MDSSARKDRNQCSSLQSRYGSIDRDDELASTGQPAKQKGSTPDLQALAIKKRSNRMPSRINRVTPPCVSAHALTHSSQRVQRSRSSTSKLCAPYNPRLRKSGATFDCICFRDAHLWQACSELLQLPGREVQALSPRELEIQPLVYETTPDDPMQSKSSTVLPSGAWSASPGK